MTTHTSCMRCHRNYIVLSSLYRKCAGLSCLVIARTELSLSLAALSLCRRCAELSPGCTPTCAASVSGRALVQTVTHSGGIPSVCAWRGFQEPHQGAMLSDEQVLRCEIECLNA